VKRTQILFYFSILAAVVSLTIALLLRGELLNAGVPVIIGIFVVAALHQSWRWGPSAGLFLFILLAGIHRGLGEIWLSISIIAVLMAWDLAHFLLRFLPIMDVIDQIDVMEGNHLKRLFWVVGLSVILLGAAQLIRLNLSFGWVLLLGLLLIVSLSRVIALLRTESIL
jgi:hypothetical protein